MAITDISEPTKFNRLLMGLTADVKPTGTEYIGSVFLEEKVDNTVLVYITKDGTNWRLIDVGDDTLAAEIAKIPKSDGAVSWNATAIAAIQAAAAAAMVADPSIAQLLIDAAAIIARQETVESTAQRRQAGREQIITVPVTAYGDAGAVVLATVTTQPVKVESIILHSDGVTTAELTSAAITGGAAGVIVFLSAVDAAVANINAQDEQVWWQGEGVYLPVAATIVITMVGTGHTVATDLNVVITYKATVDGGYLAP